MNISICLSLIPGYVSLLETNNGSVCTAYYTSTSIIYTYVYCIRNARKVGIFKILIKRLWHDYALDVLHCDSMLTSALYHTSDLYCLFLTSENSIVVDFVVLIAVVKIIKI